MAAVAHPADARPASGQALEPQGRAESAYVELKHVLHRKLLERINLDRLAEIDAPRVRREVRNAVASLVAEEDPNLRDAEREALIDQVLDEVFGLGPLDALMQDPTVSDILVTTPRLVYVERQGKLQKTAIRFKDNQHLTRIIQKIVGQAGRRIDESSPMVDCRLPDGSRVNAVIPPIAVEGPLLSIRKFSADPLTAEDLVNHGALNEEMLELLAQSVRDRRNILITGGTGSGKTTLLNVLSAYIGADERIVTIEDTAELQLRQEHVAKMECRPPNLEGEGSIKERQLVINSLRMRPDRIILGEVRGDEALDMLQAMNTGHDGSLATIHANSCGDAVHRLEMMVALANSNISSASIRQQIASAIDLFVHVARLSDGSRKVIEIAEAAGLNRHGEVALRDLFVFERAGLADDGIVDGRFVAVGGKPRFREQMRLCAEQLGDDLVPAASRRQGGEE
ncbi:MAG: ATP-binding cassette domain-containing protein [Acidobacteria bacterium]|nr:ATP-binding cassette domain-containing protein [Acidobacteriota bacterium]